MNEIFKETDYEKFKFTSKNRKIDPRKVARYAQEALKSPHLMEACPILVNEKMEIIDGQHRFLACKEKNLPIYYIRDHRLSYSDISTLNKDQKNWSLEDFVNYHCESGNKNFLKLREFVKKSGLTLSLAFVFLGFNRKSLVTAIKEGSLIFPSLEKEEIASKKYMMCRQFQKKIFSKSVSSELKMIFSYSFLEAVAVIPDDVNLEKFFKILEENYSSISACRGFNGYHYQFKYIEAL